MSHHQKTSQFQHKKSKKFYVVVFPLDWEQCDKNDKIALRAVDNNRSSLKVIKRRKLLKKYEYLTAEVHWH